MNKEQKFELGLDVVKIESEFSRKLEELKKKYKIDIDSIILEQKDILPGKKSYTGVKLIVKF